jgi:hypothetical protein
LHPKITKIIDRNRGVITTTVDMGRVEKYTFPSNPDKNQLNII